MRSAYRVKPALVFLLTVPLMITACSSGWRAPMESRGEHPAHRKPAPSSQKGGYRGTYYKVKSGDTLVGIAWQAGIDYRDIAAWNGIHRPYVIYAGQTLRLKPPPKPAPASDRVPDKTVKRDSAPAAPVPRPEAITPRPTRTRTAVAEVDAGRFDNARKLSWNWPINGQVTATYKRGDALRKGIKIAAAPGSMIRAAESGKVVYSGSGLIGYGKLIIVKHNDNYLSAYGHNRKLLVKEGQVVTKGQNIAELGTSNDGKPNLHFEIRRKGKPVNPIALLPRR